jgi:hypothetical protein
MNNRRLMNLYALISEALFAVGIPVELLDELVSLASHNNSDAGKQALNRIPDAAISEACS